MENSHSREEHDKGSPGSPPSDSSPTENSGTGNPKAGRRKIKIEFIEDKSRRHITFSKRKHGIMKKAYELSTLTGTQVLLLVASETGHVYTFATHKLQPLITKPEGKNLIQACLSTPDPASGSSQSTNPTPPTQSNITNSTPSQPSQSSSQTHKASGAANTPQQSQPQQPAPLSQQNQQPAQPQHQQQHHQQHPHHLAQAPAFPEPALTYSERPEEVYDEESNKQQAMKERVKQEQANKGAPFPNFGMEGMGAGPGGYAFPNNSFGAPGYPSALIPGSGGPGMYVSPNRFQVMPPGGYNPYPTNNPGPYPSAASQQPHNMGPYGFLPIAQNNNPKPPHSGPPK